MEIVYFDNAATSWPKPEETIGAMTHYLNKVGASPGRSGHRLSVEAGRIVYEAREVMASLFGIDDPNRIVFLKNATEALNIAAFGLLRGGDHVITSPLEHNSVMRPLRALEKRGLEISFFPASPDGLLDPSDLKRLMKKNTRAVFMTHASNVTGAILPVREMGRICREEGIIFCLDAAQTAGCVPIDVEELSVDLLAFTGHKSLFGPPGTGGLYVREGLEEKIEPLLHGGTGSKSEFEEQPRFLPDKFEAGTINTVGIAGLGAGVKFVLQKGVEKIREKELALTRLLLGGLKGIKGVKVYGPREVEGKIAVVSFNIEGKSPSEIALLLDERFHIYCRPGLHCAPSAHRTLGTFPEGTVRFSFSCFNEEEEIEYALMAIHKLCSL